MSDAAQKIQTSRLLYLPGEIRNMIMKYVFYYEPGTGPLPVSQTPLMTLPLTCRQLHAEYQNMALSSTLFYIPWSSMGADVLPGIVDRLPSMSRSAIKKLYTRLPMVQGDCIGSLLPGPNTRFIEFESAGLGQVEQLYLSYPARYRRGDNALFGLGRIMNRCLRDKKLVKLRKLCVGHYAAAYDLGLIEFSHHLTRSKDTLCKRWDVEPGLNNGQIFLVGKGQMTSRRVAIMLGYTQYEAENYCLIRQQLKKGRHVDIIAARRGHCKYLTSLKDTTDVELTAEIQMLLTNYRMPKLPAAEVASFLEAIRALPQEPSKA